MKIDFHLLEEPYINLARISKKDVIRTVTDPMMQQKVEISDLTVVLYLRKEPKGDTYLLIVGQITAEKVYEVGLSLRIRSELIQKVGTNEPLILLQQIAANFGVNQKIGEVTSKFFLRESIKVNKSLEKTELLKIELPKGNKEVDVAQSWYIKHIKERGIVECALIITVDI